MKKLKLLFASLALLVGSGTAWAQTDVTSTYITNADFEGDYSVFVKPKSDRAIYQPNGWTVTRTGSDTNDMTILKSTDLANGSFSAFTINDASTRGNQTYWTRLRWGNNTGLKLSQTKTLNPGSYTLTALVLNYNQNTGNNKAEIFAGENSATASNSNTKNDGAGWKSLTVNFTIDETKEIEIGFKLTHATETNGEQIVGVDNFVLTYTDFKAGLRTVVAQAQAINARISTLTDDITTAQGVLNTADASKSTIDDAVTTLRSAIITKLAAYDGLNAAGDDITSFIANNGFETSPTFDGTSLGSGSEPKSNATPTAGSTLLYNAKNVYQLNGWELLTTETSDFARTFTMPYDKTLYVVSNNAVAGQAVASPTNGSSVTTSNENLLFVEANWCEDAVLGVKQTVPLPAGSYRLTFDSYVTNWKDNAESRCGVSYGETTNYKWPAALDTWTANEVDFTLDAQTDVTISMGYKKIGNVGGGNSAHLFVDNVKLTYFDPLKLAQIQWQEVWDALDALDETALPDAAETAITDALSAVEPTTVEGYNSSKETMQTLIDSYDGIKAAYEKALALIVFATDEKDNSTGDKTAFETAISTATTNIETRTTAAALEEDYNTLETARQTYVTSGAQPTAGNVFDYTFKIPDAAVTSATDWSNKRTGSGEQYTGAPDNTYFDNYNENRNVQKNIGTLRLGKFELKVATRSEASVTVGNIYVSQNAANLNQTDIHHDGNTGGDLGNGWSWTTVAFDNYVDDKDITLGFYSECGSSKWAGADDFHLYYKGNAVDDETAEALKGTVVSGKMNATVASTQATALSEFESAQTFENYNTLKDAIAAASASKSAYTEANTKLTAMKAVVDATNVYTEEALAAYYGTPKSKYDEGTLTNEEAAALQDPTASTSVRAAITVDNFLLSAWNTEPDFTAEDSPYYINSWSTEGKTDGSGMTTPFFEYWVSNSSTAKLGERKLTATLSELPAGNYYVDVLVRVFKNTGENPTPYGITLDVNGGTPVNVCAGNQIGSTTYYYDTFRALGTVSGDGVLTINFNVAEDNNISWLAFKSVTYAAFNGATDAQKQDLADAITDADAMTLGFDEDEYAPYNNIDALEKLAVAKSLNLETATALEVTTATSDLNNATWYQNDADKDIVYNGSFARAEAGQNYPEGWKRTNGWGQMQSGLSGDFATAYYNQPGSLQYGNQGVYTMPLKANTIYTLTMSFRSHEENSNNAMNVSVLNESDEGLARVNLGYNKSKSNWKTVSKVFKTGAAGNYVLTLENDGNTWMTNVSIVKGSTVTEPVEVTAAGYKTYCSKNDLDFTGMTVKAYKATATAKKVTFTPVTTVPAGEGILLKGAGTFNVPVTAGVTAWAAEDNAFIGVTSETTITEETEGDGVGIFVLMNGTSGVGFYKATAATFKVGANTAYLPASVAASRMFIGFDDEEEVTGIRELNSSANKGAIYNMNGVRVEKAKKGLYIQNGKKFVVK